MADKYRVIADFESLQAVGIDYEFTGEVGEFWAEYSGNRIGLIMQLPTPWQTKKYKTGEFIFFADQIELVEEDE